MSQFSDTEPFRGRPVNEAGLLSWSDLNLVLALLAESAPGWSAELNQTSVAESTIVITPEGANDLIGPAFVLSLTRTGVELSQFRWDEYRKLGDFLLMNGALAALRARLLPLVSRADADA
jgi:hypothetical protein